MRRPKIALPVSQHFNAVFPGLKDVVDILVVRNIARLAEMDAHVLPKVYHTNGLINLQFAEEMNEQSLKAIGRHDIGYMSFDLGPSCLDIKLNPDENDCFWPNHLSPTLSREDIMKAASQRLAKIRKAFAGEISLENLDYHKGGAYEHVCEAEFISDALRSLGCGLALDIGHLSVTCFSFGIDPFEYIAKLPLELLREIHLSHAQGDFDMHAAPTEYEYGILSFLLARSAPEFIVIEYYEQPEAIIKENKRLFDFLNRNN